MGRRYLTRPLQLFVLLGLFLAASVSLAQDGIATPERQDYTPLHAGKDAYFLGEARRLGAINRQVDLNQRMRWQSWPSSYARGVFEPWPMVPGDIWGYPIIMNTRQSIGQRTYQAGTNRWISEPLYVQDLAPPPEIARPRQAVAAPPAASTGAPQTTNRSSAPNGAFSPPPGSPPPGFAPPPGFFPAPERTTEPASSPNSSGPREF